MAATVVATAEGLGLPLRKESWGISDDGMLLFGALHFDPISAGLAVVCVRLPE